MGRISAGSCVIQAVFASTSTSTGISPAAITWVAGVDTRPSLTNTNAVPSVGCPANSSSCPRAKTPPAEPAPRPGGHEPRPREADLLREGLHRLLGDVDRLRHDAELVAG